jgi:transcriptional regulator with XRE-family HTH domain
MHTPYNTALAAEMRAEMARQQMTGREIATLTGYPHASVARWLRGETPMTLDAMDAFAHALNVPLSDLLSRARSESRHPRPHFPRPRPRPVLTLIGGRSTTSYGGFRRWRVYSRKAAS